MSLLYVEHNKNIVAIYISFLIFWLGIIAHCTALADNKYLFRLHHTLFTKSVPQQTYLSFNSNAYDNRLKQLDIINISSPHSFCIAIGYNINNVIAVSLDYFPSTQSLNAIHKSSTDHSTWCPCYFTPNEFAIFNGGIYTCMDNLEVETEYICRDYNKYVDLLATCKKFTLGIKVNLIRCDHSAVDVGLNASVGFGMSFSKLNISSNPETYHFIPLAKLGFELVWHYNSQMAFVLTSTYEVHTSLNATNLILPSIHLFQQLMGVEFKF